MAYRRWAARTELVAACALLISATLAAPLGAPLGAQSEAHNASLESARALALAGRTDAALAIYDSVFLHDSASRSALLGLANTLAWARRFDGARGRYVQLLARWPADLEALQGLARLESWSGHLNESEQQWRSLATRDSLNPEVWVDLAQVLRWKGAFREAELTLERALRLVRSHERANTEMQVLRSARATALTPMLRTSRDNEGNALTTLTLGVELPLEGRRAARVVAHGRGAESGASTGQSRVLRTSVQFPLGRRASIFAEAGAVQLVGSATDERTVAIGVLRIQSELASWLTMRAAISRDVLDETAVMIQSALTSNGASVSASTQLGADWTMSAGGDVVRILSASAPNTRQQSQVALERRFAESLSAGVRAQRTAHSRVASDGYFSPIRHNVGEVLGRWTPGPLAGWHARLEAAVGRQQMVLSGAPQSGPSQRLDASVARRWRSGGEFILGYERSTVAGLVPGNIVSEVAYRFQGVRTGARIPF